MLALGKLTPTSVLSAQEGRKVDWWVWFFQICWLATGTVICHHEFNSTQKWLNFIIKILDLPLFMYLGAEE